MGLSNAERQQKHRERQIQRLGEAEAETGKLRRLLRKAEQSVGEDRRRISERTSFALDAKKRANDGGPINGRAPYGSRWQYPAGRTPPDEVNRLVPDPVEGKIVALARSLAQSMKSTAIARALNVSGHVTRSGKPWGDGQVRRILQRL